MKILVAETAGFCMGVRRAVDLAIDASASREAATFTLGPLIHNTQTVELLESRGVRELRGDDVPAGATILIRAHGVPPQIEARLRERGHTIIDGTCPKVKTVHKVIQRYREMGYTIIIAGDAGHAEVVGLLGYAGDAGRLVHSPEDIAALPAMPKVCLVAQTTFDRAVFAEISRSVKERFSGADVVVKKTICSATDRRQAETEAMARQVEAMIVVGGKNSANTMRLVKIARACGAATQHVESEAEIDLTALAHCSAVGVTAGASTPRWLVTRVVDFLEMHQRRAMPAQRINRIAEMLVSLNVVAAAGAGAAYYASCVFQRIPLEPRKLAFGGMISFLYFFSMYLWNSLTNIHTTRHLGLRRYVFYRSHARMLSVLAAACMLAILLMAYVIGPPLFFLMFFAIIAGMLYHATLIPEALKGVFTYRSLKDIPLSRDLFVALAWGTILTFVPHAIIGSFIPSASTAFAFVWISLYAFLRSVIVDLRDIEGDRVLGRETLVTILSERRVRSAMKLLMALSVIALTGSFVAGRKWPLLADSLLWIMQAPVPCYLWLFITRSRSLPVSRPAIFSILADAQFFLMAACAFAAQYLFAR